MSGSALDIALAIDSTKTKVSDFIAILDGVYVEENNLSLKFDEFDQMKREKDRNIKEFIHVYEQKLNELKAEKLVLPDLIVANKLLRAANLSPNRYLLARSTCQTMTLAEAKAALILAVEVHVVDTNIPLLLSLKTMKNLGLRINFEKDQAEINGKLFELEMTSTGHYTLPLIKSFTFCSEACVINTVDSGDMSPPEDTKKKALKLHRRFAHARSERIINLLDHAGKRDTALETELRLLDKSCEFC